MMEQPFIQQPAMRIEIPVASTSETETTDGFFRKREWQIRCSAKLGNSRNWIITAPPAAGKSLEICSIAADRLKRDEQLRAIIAVPQTIIAEGFRANTMIFPNGERIAWTIWPGVDEILNGCTMNM